MPTPRTTQARRLKPDRGTCSRHEHSRSIGDVCAHLFGNQEWKDLDSLWGAIWMWPPDVFAMTSLLLRECDTYRAIAAPPEGRTLPVGPSWEVEVRSAANEWIVATDAWWEARRTASVQPGAPKKLQELKKSIGPAFDRPIECLTEGHEANGGIDLWSSFCALVELHSVADEACEGLGIPGDSPLRCWQFSLRAETLLVTTGSLSRIPTDRIRVLPKMRTPRAGLTLRNLSHHVCIDDSGIQSRWHVYPGLRTLNQARLNLLLIPWPYEVEPGDFHAAESPISGAMDARSFGFFTFEPTSSRFNPAFFRAIIEEAKAKGGGRLDGVVLPELALTRAEAAELRRLLHEYEVPLLLTGVREPAQRPVEEAGTESPSVAATSGAARNYALLDLPLTNAIRYVQHKHHRWCLDEWQIEGYGLRWQLNPGTQWWEDINVRERKLTFVTASGWLTLCHLICEDLARIEPVGQLLRSVGPNLVIALLLDGPQLKNRWSARYAMALAEDPGCSVLSVTSYGMAMRSRYKDKPPQPVIACWKDPASGDPQELRLKNDSAALLLTVCPRWGTEWTMDGRSDSGFAATLLLVAHEQIGRRSALRNGLAPGSSSPGRSTKGGNHPSNPDREAKLRRKVSLLSFIADALASGLCDTRSTASDVVGIIRDVLAQPVTPLWKDEIAEALSILQYDSATDFLQQLDALIKRCRQGKQCGRADPQHGPNARTSSRNLLERIAIALDEEGATKGNETFQLAGHAIHWALANREMMSRARPGL